MTFKSGESGNPSGKQPLKPWRRALDRALAQDEADPTRPTRLRGAAEALLNAAAAGDLAAIRELGDRLDGKSIQEIAAQVDANITVEIVKFADKTPK